MKLLRLACLIASFSLCVPDGAWAQAGGGPSARADELFREGRAAALRKDWPGAFDAYTEAWKLRQSFDIAANLGQAELKLERYALAAEHLRYALDHFPASNTSPTARARIADALNAAKEHVSEIRVEVNRPGARVSAAGRVVGTSPLSQPVYLEPGEHELQASLDGHTPVIVRIGATAGSERTVRIELEAADAARGDSASEKQQGQRSLAGGAHPSDATWAAPVLPPPRKSYAPLIVSTAVTLVGATGWITFGIAANNAEEDADRIARSAGLAGESACEPGRASPQCGEFHDALRKHDRYSNYRTVGAVVTGIGAVSAIGSLVYLMIPGPRSRARLDAAMPYRIHASMERDARLLVLDGRF